jgi:RNA polymerase sigma factor (sigma-70 family)
VDSDITSSLWPNRLARTMDSEIKERRAELALTGWTQRLAHGDEEAWRWFHERYYLSLLRLAAHRAGDPSAASEIVQQAYLRVARHIRPFADEADFWRWLCCLVRCAAVDHSRHVQRRALLLEKFAHWRARHAEADAACHPSANSTATLAEEALSRVSGEDATLLRRKYCDGWSTQELAAEGGTTVKAVENRLARLRQRVRDIILCIQ